MKTTLIALLLALALFVAGCSSEEKQQAQNDDATTAEQQEPQASADSAPQSAAVEQPHETGMQDSEPAPKTYDVSPIVSLDAANDKNAVLDVIAAAKMPWAGERGSDTAASSPEVDVTVEVDILQPEAKNEAAQPVPSGEPVTAATPAPVKAQAAEAPGFSLHKYVALETAKSRNYPFSPQVGKEPVEEKVTVDASFGVEAPQTPRPAVPEEATPPAAPARREAASPPPAPQAASAPPAAPEPQAAPKHDLGVGFGAPEIPKPAPEPEKVAAVEKPAPRPAPAAPAPRPVPVAKAEPVIIGNVPVEPLSPDKPLNPEATTVTEQFKKFAVYWVRKISSNYLHGIDNKEVVNEGGTFVARYTHLDPKSVSLLIKEKPYDHTPFVGLMKYTELTFQSTGATPEEALNGRFKQVQRLGITEIFRYSKGKWIE